MSAGPTCIDQRRNGRPVGLDALWSGLNQVYGAHDVVSFGDQAGIGVLETVSNGALTVGVASGRNFMFTRSKAMLDPAWHDYVFLVRQDVGELTVHYQDTTALLVLGDVMLIDSRGACSFRSTGHSRSQCFQIPRAAIDRSGQHANSTAAIFRNDVGIGHLLSRFLDAAVTSGNDFEDDEELLIGTIVQSFIDRALTPAINARRSWPPNLLRLSMRDWVCSNLDDAALAPPRLARAFDMSTRQLYRMFSSHGLTPGAWIWQVRVEAARRLILDCPDRSLTEVALATGFADSAHFSRRYKLRFGVTPSAARAASRNGYQCVN